MKIPTLLIAVLLLTFVSAQAQVTSLTGTGTSNDPYLIGTTDELVFMRAQVNTGVTGYPAAYYKLTSNVDLSTYADWSSIGSTTYPFSGTFDGNGNKIIHLKTGTSGTPTSTGNPGLFAVVTDAKITNLTIESDGIYATGVSNAGILAATVTGTIISNCNVSGILSTANATTNYIGGLIGKSSGSKVVNCMSDVTLTANGTGTNVVNCGGLVGNLSSGTFQGTASVNSVIYNSYSKGSVYSSTISSVSYTGGIVGNIAGGGSIYNCYTSTSVKGESTTGSANTYVGGVVGQGVAGLDIKYCIALNSSVTCINATGTKQIGRIAGATVGTAINYDADYGLETMTVQTGTASNTLATVNLGTKLITNKQGGDLGSSVPKNLLNAYVTSNTSPNGTSWLFWTTTAGVNNDLPYFTTSNPATQIEIPTNRINIHSSNGKIIISGLQKGQTLSIYNMNGQKVWYGLANEDKTEITLKRGIYILSEYNKLIINQ